MFDLKALVEKGIKNGSDAKEMLLIVTDSLDNDNEFMSTYKHLYKEIYGDHLCDAFCEKWVEDMHNSTSHGQKWSCEQTTEQAKRNNISFEDNFTEHEFYAAMNMMYYDYSEMFHAHGISTEPTVFAKMAQAYFDDVDSKHGKLLNYFFFLYSE